MPYPFRACALAVLTLPILAFQATAEGKAKPPAVAPQALLERLQQGGYVIFIRHAQTDKEGADQVKAVMGDCATQRTLSEAGWRQAKRIGAGLGLAGTPIAQVVASQYCRAWQTADIAFGRHVKSAALNFEKAETYSPEQIKAMRDAMAPLLSAAPPPGFNAMLVGHDDPFEAATGYYPEPQGVMVVLKPDGRGGYAMVGEIKPEYWERR